MFEGTVRLDEIETEARRNAAAIERLDELTPAQLAWRPAAESWSVAECCDHLIRTGEVYHPRLRSAIAEAQGTAGGDPPRIRLALPGRWFLRAAGPGGRAVRAPRIFRPSPEPRETAATELRSQQDVLLGLIAGAGHVDPNRARVKPPLPIPLLTFGVGEILAVLVAHQRRHLDQAQRVLEAPGFPGVATS